MQSELQVLGAEYRRLTSEIATERAISTRFLEERDVISRALETEQAITTRLLASRQSPPSHVIVLSSYLGAYTSEFLDGKSAKERAALLEDIRERVRMIMSHSQDGLPWEDGTDATREIMARHGFRFLSQKDSLVYERGAPSTGLEILERQMRSHRMRAMGSLWYFHELMTVVFAVAKYLEAIQEE